MLERAKIRCGTSSLHQIALELGYQSEAAFFACVLAAHGGCRPGDSDARPTLKRADLHRSCYRRCLPRVQLIYGEYEKHIVRLTTAQNIFRLLPEIRPHFELGQVGSDQRGAGDNASGNVWSSRRG